MVRMRRSLWAIVLLCIPQPIGNCLLILIYALPDTALSRPPFRWLSPWTPIVAFMFAAYAPVLLLGAGPLASRVIRECGVRSREGAIALGALILAL